MHVLLFALITTIFSKGFMQESESNQTATDSNNFYKCHEGWHFIEETNTKYKISQGIVANFSVAARICQKLGGNIFMIPNVAVHKVISGQSRWWHNETVSYWLGLRTNWNRKWYWINNKQVGKYKNWATRPLKREACAAIQMSEGHVKWYAVNCSSTREIICETVVPCLALPMLEVVVTIPNTDTSNSSNATNTNSSNGKLEQILDIRCTLLGHVDNSTEVTINCPNHDPVQEKGVTTLDLSFPITVAYNGKECTCTTQNEDSELEASYLTVYLKSSPVLLKSTQNGTTFQVDDGKDALMTFDIKANPKPYVFNLKSKRNHKSLELADKIYLVAVESTSDDLKHALHCIMYNFSSNQTGTYVLTAGNGVVPDLYLAFNLIAKVPKEPSFISSNLKYIVIGVIMLLAVLFIAAAFFLIARRKRVTRLAEAEAETLEGEDESEGSAEEAGSDASDADDSSFE